VQSLSRHAHKFTLAAIVAMIGLHGPAAIGAQSLFTPASYVNGQLPVAPVLAVSAGEVFLQVNVTADGSVDSIRTLRTTPPFTDATIDVVRGWRFTPATDDESSPGSRAPVAGPVFVAAMFAPPALNGPTLGQPPTDVLSAPDDIPYPTHAVPADYPPRAIGDGAVLVDVTVDGNGVLTDTEIKSSSPAFAAASMIAARLWSFRPARRNGRPVTTHTYILFVFRQPVVGVR
jgi:TonB family protein